MFKLLGNRKGFSLVELIVVIVILGILVAIAVPSLIGYIDQANISADLSAASGLYDATFAYIVDQGLIDTPLTNAEISKALIDSKVYSSENWPKTKKYSPQKDMLVEYTGGTDRTIIITTDSGEQILPALGADEVYAPKK